MTVIEMIDEGLTDIELDSLILIKGIKARVSGDTRELLSYSVKVQCRTTAPTKLTEEDIDAITYLKDWRVDKIPVLTRDARWTLIKALKCAPWVLGVLSEGNAGALLPIKRGEASVNNAVLDMCMRSTITLKAVCKLLDIGYLGGCVS